MNSAKKVAIVSKPSKPELKAVAPELVRWLETAGYEVHVDQETSVYAPGSKVTPRSQIVSLLPDFAIVLGGDGTLLAAARAVAKANIPLLAVNLGSLGFLTEIPLSEMYVTLEALDQNRCLQDTRSMLKCVVMRGGECIGEFLALNDIVISKGVIARMAEVDVAVNGQSVASYKADGVIISTPTGSTAYSLAAGGPVLEPAVQALVITPVSPHALTNRPLVVRDTAEIVLTLQGVPDDAHLTVDGQIAIPVLEGDRALCSKSEHSIRLIRLPGRAFFDVLRTKLKWGER